MLRPPSLLVLPAVCGCVVVVAVGGGGCEVVCCIMVALRCLLCGVVFRYVRAVIWLCVMVFGYVRAVS